MKHFRNPLDISHVSIQLRACKKRLERGAKTWKVIGRTFSVSHSRGPIRFLTASLAKFSRGNINHMATCQPRKIVYL